MKPADLHCDVLVIGAGPAGLAAVAPLLEAGRRVAWVDNQAQPGGQIWRGGLQRQAEPRLQALSDRIASHRDRLQALHGGSVMAIQGPGQWLIGGQDLSGSAAGKTWHRTVRPEQVLLASGARERFVPLPGWTLPGVTGAGGLQALIKGGWPVQGQRVVLAGSGPLLLAAADTARTAGAQVLLIAEQAPAVALLRFAAGLPPAKLAQAAALRWRLRGTPYRAGVWPVRVLGEQRLSAVVLTDGLREWTVDCDALGLGFGLIPNTEIASGLGCRLRDGAVDVDAQLRTSVATVWCVGEGTGIGGVDKALVEGELAARHLLGQTAEAQALTPRHQAALKFATRLTQHFALRPELFKLADSNTLVCRCEDVSVSQLRGHSSWRDAKLQTRCGMGACQGRICAPIAHDLMGWPDAGAARGVRMPMQPCSVKQLLGD